MTAHLAAAPMLLAVGEPLIALSPPSPVPIEASNVLQVNCGGAEVNTAVGVRRLGLPAAVLGRVGDDPLGRGLLDAMAREGVDTSLVRRDPAAPTGLYLREWLADGVRRPYYYRRGTAGARLHPDDWPRSWPVTLPAPKVLHVSGITSALSPDAADALDLMIGRARALGALISVDPNHRPGLWPDVAGARQMLRALADRADVLLLSEDDAALLVGSTDVDRVHAELVSDASRTVVFKRGIRGATAWAADAYVDVPACEVAGAIDPVGAGDAFNAGLLAATMLGAPLADAMRVGAWCGARAVETFGEHTGYPRRDQLPDELRAVLGAEVPAASGAGG